MPVESGFVENIAHELAIGIGLLVWDWVPCNLQLGGPTVILVEKDTAVHETVASRRPPRNSKKVITFMRSAASRQGL